MINGFINKIRSDLATNFTNYALTQSYKTFFNQKMSVVLAFLQTGDQSVMNFEVM